MEVGAPNSEVVNMTRAIEAVAPMLINPRKTVTQVEVLVSVAAALMFLQFVLGFCKRLWHNSAANFFLKVCDKAMFPFIVYILGTMQTSPIKNSVYPAWAVSLIMASEATRAVKPDLPTIENLMPIYIEAFRYLFYYIIFSQLLNPSTPKFSWPPGHKQHYRSPNASSTCTSYLFALVVLSKLIEGVYGLAFGFSHCEVVARWMKTNAKKDDLRNINDVNLNEYNYLVRYSLNVKNLPANLSTDRASSNANFTTVKDICNCFENSKISTDHKERLKEVCLSFAMFELLKRRYFGIFCAEGSLHKTKYFVSRLLLKNPDNDYQSAFKVVETELGFFYDFLFTKYELIYTTGLYPITWIFWFIFSLGKMILISVVGVYAIKNSLVLETPSPIVEVHSAKADYIIATAFICIILIVYLLQAFFYLASDWVKVSLASTYVKRKECAFILEKVVGFLFLCKMNISAGCKNTIGQCSIISDRSEPTPFNKIMTPAVKVSVAVKKAIANAVRKAIESLVSGDVELSKGKIVYDEYGQTLEDHSQIEVMLILHIATDYCDLALSGEGKKAGDRDVAVMLSRYYAYLIAFVPELLPYNVADITEWRTRVREEIEALPSRRTSRRHTILKMFEIRCFAPYTAPKMYDIMMGLEGTDTSVFMKGVKLGKQLEEKSKTDADQTWRMLAEFWAENIVYITPSHHTAKHHMEHVESGGEFLTQIWVLLSHAGILNLDREKDQGLKPTERQTA